MACSITGGYLAKFDNIPCYYMTLIYNSKFGVAGTIVTVGINFTIDNDQLNRLSVNYINEQKKLRLDKKDKNKKVDDKKDDTITKDKLEKEEECEKYAENASSIEIKKRTVDINLKKLIGNELYGNYDISITCDRFERDEFLLKMKEKFGGENESLFTEYVKLFSPIKLESYPSKNVIIYSKLLKYLQNDKFMDFVHFILDKRFAEKSKEMHTYFDQKLPKNIFSYKKLKDNPELLDQMLDNDDRSSNNSSSDEDSCDE